MPIRFASEAWLRPGLAEPRSASIVGFGNTEPLSSREQKGKDGHDQDKGLVLGSFLVPEIDMIFGDGVGGLPCSRPLLPATAASGNLNVRGPYCQLGVGLMRFYIGTAQLKKVLGWA